MHPLLRDEDLVVVKKVPYEKLKIGNILVYNGRDKELLIHRLVGKCEDGRLCLRGDGYNLSRETVSYEAITGKAIGVVRNGRVVGLTRIMEWYFSKACTSRC